MGVLGIIISLALLTFIAYRGYSVILFAPLCALLAALIAGVPLLPTYSEVFMTKGMAFARLYFPLFLIGAVFGKLMETTGAASSIAHWITQKVGKKGTILAVVLSCGILAYGGVSIFVVAFAVYPIGAALFREAGIPKRLLPGAIALGSWTFAMTALPGTPQIQNLIPVKYFGTDAYAAPILGLLAGICMFVFGVIWLEYRKNKALAAGEGYGTGHKNEPDALINPEELMKPGLAIVPLLIVLILNYILTRVMQSWDPAFLEPYGASLKTMAPLWALLVSVAIASLFITIVGWKRINGEANFKAAITAGVSGSLLAIMNTSSEVGYGSVIKSLPAFDKVADFMMGIDFGTPLVSEAITVNVLAGITGSASGGMTIALEAMGARYLEWANAVGLNPELLHKVASLASGGFDALPHNGAVITLLAICGLTHKSSYKDIFMTAVLIPFASTFLIIILATLFGAF
ncbi:GntP family permease [Caldisalinibacter kiritimatiensis]|uniref:D-beta-hydroxybutyrate permease n=1 Tax=Caldisalinibacter kiritimatiensis TaxID=1304284 RepID=R1AWL6_9FIRM|nr:GntP family permease [Caldisalinibacter kiritimatiensis]EOD01573.1 D-beta-hydroxybutyrate permease [Caldisalinibacter kiritimatiensis]